MKISSSVRRLTIIVVALLLVAGGVAWYCGVLASLAPRMSQNAIALIVPYRYGGTWVFDYPQAGLVREPFVGGVPEMLDVLVADIPAADKGFRLYFSASAFPGYQKKLTWTHADSTGNWYRTDDPPMEGWLCPALLRYYRAAPKELYVKAEPKS
jgi:hypothetical protein